MLNKLILISLLIIIPASAWAEDSPTLAPSSSGENQTLGPANSDTPGPGTGAAQLLQPASPTTLQSLQAADATSGGIPQPTTNSDLQAAGGQTQFKDFAGLTTDPTLKVASATPQNHTLAWLLALLGLAAVVWYMPRLQNPNPKSKS